MTAQAPESINYEGAMHALCATPLGDYFALGGRNPGFAATSTALWRGYVGSWEVVEDRLYLVGLKGVLSDGTAASLGSVFPGFTDRVFAHWYCGTLRIPQGGLVHYVHGGYDSTYERDLLLQVEQGEVVGTQLRENGARASENAPVGYQIAAMTRLRTRDERKDSDV